MSDLIIDIADLKKGTSPINKIICGDCLEAMEYLPDESIDLVVADPPYGINKASWDKRGKKINYHFWIVSIFAKTQKLSKPNATLWFFHMVFDDLTRIHLLLQERTDYRHKQLIIINKGIKSVAGRSPVRILRSFPRATEYIQFYTFEDRTGAEELSEKYQKINPIAKYLAEEFHKANVTNTEIAKLFPSKTGGLTGCVSNWLLGENVPSKKQYLEIRKYLNYKYLHKEYEDLRKEYEDLRKEYEDLRYCFNLYPQLTDVWSDISFCSNNNKHETPKPLQLLIRVIQTASMEDFLILDPFLGSGTTAVACERLNRKWIGIEIEPKYCEIAAKRIEDERRQPRLPLEVEPDKGKPSVRMFEF